MVFAVCQPSTDSVGLVCDPDASLSNLEAKAEEIKRLSDEGLVIGTAVLMLALPLGAFASAPVAHLPGPVVAGFLAFGLMALLFLVTEELLVEAHKAPDSPWITSLFFAGFLAVLLLDQLIG